MEVRSALDATPESPALNAAADSFRDREVIFLDRHAAHGSQSAPYRLACQLFHCGLIDRTETLDLGFAAKVVDPLGDILNASFSARPFDAICDQRADEILDEAIDSDRRVQVLWSGGIDSTVAIIALLQVATKRHCQDRLQILCSIESVSEYRTFFHKFLWRQYEIQPVGYPVSSYLSPDALIVTGEHGDQLYGSDLLRPYVENGLAFVSPWQDVLPFALAAQQLRNDDATAVQDYLEPLMQACPIAVTTLFDFFWWLNFSAKWQSVTLRIPANAEFPQQVLDSTRHFFRPAEFQLWSLFKHDRPVMDSWRNYKMPSKQYIFEFTGDHNYRLTKEKEQSLRLVFAGESNRRRRPPPPGPPGPGGPGEVDAPTARGLMMDSSFNPIWLESASAT